PSPAPPPSAPRPGPPPSPAAPCPPSAAPTATPLPGPPPPPPFLAKAEGWPATSMTDATRAAGASMGLNPNAPRISIPLFSAYYLLKRTRRLHIGSAAHARRSPRCKAWGDLTTGNSFVCLEDGSAKRRRRGHDGAARGTGIGNRDHRDGGAIVRGRPGGLLRVLHAKARLFPGLRLWRAAVLRAGPARSRALQSQMRRPPRHRPGAPRSRKPARRRSRGRDACRTRDSLPGISGRGRRLLPALAPRAMGRRHVHRSRSRRQLAALCRPRRVGASPRIT